MDKSILDNNLNGTVSYGQFFEAFGYKPEDTIFIRRFDDKKKRKNSMNMQVELRRFKDILPALTSSNNQGDGIYFIVNGGGQNDEDVKRHKVARAQFIEIDPSEEDLLRVEFMETDLEMLLQEQMERISAFALEPSIIIRTRKSLHCYWLLDGGDIMAFRPLQERLIQYFDSDRTIKNESRVMRLYGFNHCKEEPVMVRLIKFNPELRYTQQQFDELLPQLKKPEKPAADKAPETRQRTTATAAPAAGSDITIPMGQRHYYVMQRIGFYTGKLKGTADAETILMLVEADFRKHCEDSESVTSDHLRENYLPTIRKYLEQQQAEAVDGDFYHYAMQAWRAENPGKRFDSNTMSWDEVRAAGQRAKEAGKRFDSGRYATAAEDFADVPAAPAADPGQKAAAAGADPGNQQPADGQPAADPEAEQQDFLDAFYDLIQTEAYKPRATGLHWFDDFLSGGLLPQSLLMLMAAPGTGKTTLVMNIAEAMARHQKPVIYIALEMSPDQMLAKAISMYSAITAEHYNSAVMTMADVLQGYAWDDLQRQQVKHLLQQYKEKSYPWIKYENASSNYADILKHINAEGEKAAAAGKDAPVIVLDYLHLVTAEGQNMDVAELLKLVVKGLKDYAMKYSTICIAISAINRTSNGRITLSSGRDSSNLEYTADYTLSFDYAAIDAGQVKIKEVEKIARLQRQPFRRMILRVLKSRHCPPGRKQELQYDAAHNAIFNEEEYLPGYAAEWVTHAWEEDPFDDEPETPFDDKPGQQAEKKEELPPPIPAGKAKRH